MAFFNTEVQQPLKALFYFRPFFDIKYYVTARFVVNGSILSQAQTLKFAEQKSLDIN